MPPSTMKPRPQLMKTPPTPDMTGEESSSERMTKEEFDQITSGIEDHMLDANLKRDYTTIVAAGMKILFDDKTHHLLKTGVQKMKNGEHGGIVDGSATIASLVIKLIDKQSNGQMNKGAACGAVITLVCHVLEFAQANRMAVSKEDTAKAIHKAVMTVTAFFGITPQMLEQGAKINAAGGLPDEEDMPIPEDELPKEMEPMPDLPEGDGILQQPQDAVGGM